MEQLHKLNIIHRDIACRNFLVCKNDSKYTIKISDFGLARSVDENTYFGVTTSHIISLSLCIS